MPLVPETNLELAAAPRIELRDGLIRIHDPRTFQHDSRRGREVLVRRAFSLSEVQQVVLDRENATLTIRHVAQGPIQHEFQSRLAHALRGEIRATREEVLPPCINQDRLTLWRHRSVITLWEVVHDSPGRLRLRHDALASDPALVERVRDFVIRIPGAQLVRGGSWSRSVLIQYDPLVTSPGRLIRAAELALPGAQRIDSRDSHPVPVKFGLANATLGVATLAELGLPLMVPVSSLLLIGTNLQMVRAAFQQVRNRQLGLPVLYTAIIGTTLASGQFLASAAMSWMFKFWNRRFRYDLVAERQRILDSSLPDPATARLMIEDGSHAWVTLDQLQPGDLVCVQHGDVLPADGKIVRGEGVVDERSVRGLEGVSRKRVGDSVLAGSTLLTAELVVEAVRFGEESRVSSIRRVLTSATRPTPGTSAPTRRSELFAARAVAPTLATAGLGLLAGDLATVSAILRPDYATGPGIAVPLETMRDVASCVGRGILIHSSDVFEKLASTDVLLVRDQAALHETALEVTRIETRMPEAILLQYAASALRHVEDERVSALAFACRTRNVHLLNLEAVDIQHGVTVAHDKHKIRVFDAPADRTANVPLLVELDGTVVAKVEFRKSETLAAANLFRAIHTISPVSVVLISDRSNAETSALADALGVDSYHAGLANEEIVSLLRGCRDRGLRVAYLGGDEVSSAIASACDVTIAIRDDAAGLAHDASVEIRQSRMSALAELWRIAHSHAANSKSAHRFMLLPNLLCVAGAFLLGFNGLASVMISNLGTLGLYRRASDSLQNVSITRRAVATRTAP